MRRGDGVEIAGEVEVHVLHRHDLRIAAAGRTALDAEVRAERSLADADDGLLADAVQPVAEADRRGRLAFAGRRRVDGGDQDQLAVLAAALRGDELGRDLRLVVAVGQKVLCRDAELGADLHDRLLLGGARDLDVGLHFGHDGSPEVLVGNVAVRAAVCPLFPARIEPERPASRRLKTAAQCTDCDRKSERIVTAMASAAGRSALRYTLAYRVSTLLISTRFERTRRM